VIRVLLAEDQAMIREALAALLSFEDDIEVVAQVGRGDEVTSAAREAKPDVALLDIEMPGADGLTAAADARTSRSSSSPPSAVPATCAGPWNPAHPDLS
jgi:two-component system response regulator DesR